MARRYDKMTVSGLQIVIWFPKRLRDVHVTEYVNQYFFYMQLEKIKNNEDLY